MLQKNSSSGLPKLMHYSCMHCGRASPWLFPPPLAPLQHVQSCSLRGIWKGPACMRVKEPPTTGGLVKVTEMHTNLTFLNACMWLLQCYVSTNIATMVGLNLHSQGIVVNFNPGCANIEPGTRKMQCWDPCTPCSSKSFKDKIACGGRNYGPASSSALQDQADMQWRIMLQPITMFLK